MIKSIWMWILTNVFKVQTETRPVQVEENQVYAAEYEKIDSINFNAIFSNKIANYVVNDSEFTLDGQNARVDLLNLTGQSMWKKIKKITSMTLGYGGVFLVPYVKGKKIFYTIVPQNRVTIDKVEGDLITGATILAEKKTITTKGNEKTYLRWSNYVVENNKITIKQEVTDERGIKIDEMPEFWKNLPLKQTFAGVDRVLMGYVKSPVNNRKANDNYGVPITYGCSATIKEIKDTMKQIVREYKLKEVFIGADSSLFKGRNALPEDGLYRKIDGAQNMDKTFWEVFDPEYRDYTTRLQELYKRLEHEVGTSYGILSEVDTANATATEIKRSMYDTFTIVDDTRSAIEKGLEDFFYACNVLANAFNLSAQGKYELSFSWSYSLLEDTQAEWSQMMWANTQGIISNVEVRQWLKPDEDEEQAKKAIEDIKKDNPKIEDLLGTKNE